MAARLDLHLAQAPAGSSGAYLSQLGRELLSRLAAQHGFDCPLDGWSPRGSGPPKHPALPSPWQASLSHRDGRVIAGLAPLPIGIDLEHTRTRHARRLAALIDLLPEHEVRRSILLASDSQAAFYRAWTLHEALYKLSSLQGEAPSSVFATRLQRLAPRGDAHAWLWQTPNWTLAVTSFTEDLLIHTRPTLSLPKFIWA
ncbi:4'-phosphopantetheinyl transferase superfamily protein [Litchfieldella anticariensis]|nr:4'-phosphopantetheinyl transferase superfamily protein [Halomonas anticariensis]